MGIQLHIIHYIPPLIESGMSGAFSTLGLASSLHHHPEKLEPSIFGVPPTIPLKNCYFTPYFWYGISIRLYSLREPSGVLKNGWNIHQVFISFFIGN